MSSSYRIRTELGIDKVIQVKLEQNFDTLELLSLSINPNDTYIRACADYGVVVGRVFCNNGFGLPNAKISIFIALDEADINDTVISTLYPYRTINDVNEDGYKYNLLPYTPSYTGHIPVGTFPDRNDALTNKSVIQVYDKYFKFVVTTNGSGDFMILGVPPGQHTLFMQVDLSDIGEFSFTPADLIRIGRATESQVNGAQFKFSENYSELPQIVTISKTVQVAPFYGEQETCDYYIARTDFDLTAEAQVTISPTAVFMGSLVSTVDETKLGYNNVYDKCKIPKTMGDLCDLTSGPGQILAIRQSYRTDSDGLPILETVELENGGKVIDENGTWLLEVPMNLDYVYTDEEGNQQITQNPEVGIPTKGKYRFKVKWEQGPELSESTKRAYFLVPNIKEYGWTNSDDPYLDSNFNQQIGIPVSVNIPSNSPNENGEYVYLSEYLNEFETNKVYRLTNTLNVENFQIFYSNGTQYLSQNIYPEDFASLYFVYDRIDNGSDAIINFLKIDEDRFLLEQSYAFSLDWTDYANISAAINCEDTFMELQYNKVYTVSQLMDRYVSERRPWNTTGIKNILDDKCTGEYNKFPTNDAFFRVNFTYIVYNIFFEIFRYIAMILMIIAHILGFLWLVVGPILAGIIVLIQSVVRGICIGLNWIRRRLGRPERPCLTPIDVSSLFAGNPFKNLGLPLLLYTEDGCERCNCRLDDQRANFDAIGQPNLFTLLNTSILIDSTDFSIYQSDNIESDYVSGIYAGNVNPNQYFLYDRFPIVTSDIEVEVEVNNNETDIKQISNNHFSTNIPFSEVLNSWNNKGRYFTGIDIETDFGNFNLFYGSTRMIVSIEPDLNNPQTKYHMDNFTVLLIDPTASPLETGKIVSFQDRDMSNDPNYFSEQREIYATGTTSNLSHVNIRWTNPQTAGQMMTTYNISGFDSLPKTTGFPSDIEYYQVITGWTIGEYKQIASDVLGNNNAPKFADFWNYNMSHYEWATMDETFSCYRQRVRRFDNPQNIEGISDLITNIDDYQIVILMRGVDVHSPRVKQRIYMEPFFQIQPYGGAGYVNGNGSLPTINQTFNNPNFYIEGYYKLNVPLQPNLYSTYHCVRHNQLGTNNDADQYGGTVFYDSYAFSYTQNLFSPYTTNMMNYYSSFDRTTFGQSAAAGQIPPQFSTNDYNPLYLDFSAGYVRNNLNINFMGGYFDVSHDCPGSGQGNCVLPKPTTTVITFNRWNFPDTTFAYYSPYSTFEGQSFYFLNFGISGLYDDSCESCSNEPCSRAFYLSNKGFISPSYNSTNSFANSNTDGYSIFTNINIVNKNKIVVRTDRLPTSTSESINGGNSYFMHQNPTFAIFQYDDTGEQSELTNVTQQAFSINDSTNQFLPYAEVADSLADCEKAVMLKCYELINGVPTIKPDCEELMNPTSSNKKFFNYGTGCYNLVSKLIATIPDDIRSIVEWSQRVKVNNAVCFNVFSHSFSNQWINGTLYAYPFNNKRVFTGTDNRPYSIFCRDTIYFHETSNNFYYRSSPWSVTEGFIGKNNTTFGNTIDFGNYKFLQSPTTILDLGPKAYFIQELVNNDDYDGYIVSKIKSTSYNNVSEILNLFILSRLVNPNFLQFLIPTTPGVNEGTDDPTVRGFFKNRRWENNNSSTVPALVDADYAQMISVNSEFGISPFSVSNYAQPLTSIYQPVILGDENNFPFFGLLLTGNTQDRDYISPRRTIWNPQATIDTPPQYNFTEIPVKTQEVPFYLWKLIKMNNENGQPMDYGTIFGSQNNNWVTNYPDSTGEFNNSFFQYKYQKLDRFNNASRYFQVDGNLAANYRGTLINFDSNNIPTDTIPTQNFNPQFLVGAPNHFYFGLKRGGSALDRFLIKYVNTEEVIE
jgi:hypothetical protein